MKVKQVVAIAGAGLAAAVAIPAVLMANPVPAGNQGPLVSLAPDVTGLVQQLSHEDFRTRQAATRKLWEKGAEALPALRGIVKGKDPEASERAAELLLYIGAGVLPDSSEEIKNLVIQFSRSDADKKLTILRKLTQMGQWRQVLHLARMEKDEATRQKMADLVRITAGKAVREAIVAGDHQLAAEVFKLIGDSDQALVMRAWYYKQRGQLDEQLEAAKKIPGKKGARWRLAMHRADGNVPASLKEARVLGEAKLIAALELIQGDPLPWLLADIPKAGLADIPNLALQIQLAHLRGEDKTAREFAQELVPLARDSATNRSVTTALAGNGFRGLAVDLMARREPLSAFMYFDNMESPEQALKMLGITQEVSAPYTKWVKKTTAQALEDEEYITYSKILMLGGFLARHGERQHVIPVVKPLMDALREDGSDVWFDLIYSMAIYDLGKEALQFVEQRGNEDGEADKAVKKIFRNMQEKSVVHIWEALKKRNNLDVKKSLHQIAILSGLLQGGDNEVGQLQDALLAEIKEGKGVDENVRYTALFTFAETRGDLDACVAMLKMRKGDELWLKAKRYYDKELFKWADIEPYYAEKVEADSGDYRSAAYLYIALRKQGKDQDTKDMLDRILLLSMGDPSVLGAVASEFYKVGFYKEATELWLQAMIMAEPGGRYFDSALNSLAEHPQYFYDTAQWSKSAAITEASIQMQFLGSDDFSINDLLRARFRAEFANGMAQLKSGKRKQAIATLDAARKLVPGDGTLADHFFPLLRKAGIGKTYDVWFNESYRHVAKAGALYPRSHNTHNTAAWLCSRAARMLDAALEHSAAALKERPHQGAYLDTMAEVWFAKGNRAKAEEWSQKAVNDSKRYPQGVFRMRKYAFENFQQLQLQLDRFKTAPLPVK